MKNTVFFISIFIIILFSISCDVLIKMNESEWNDKNLDEEKEDIFFIYVAGIL